MAAIDIKARPGDLLRQMGGKMYQSAREKNISLSVLLEREDPSSDYPESDLDAYERVLMAAGIVTRSNIAQGVYASTWDDLWQDDSKRALIPEFARRMWSAATNGDPNTRILTTGKQRPEMRALYTTGDDKVGSLANPYVDSLQLRADKKIAPAIPLAALIAQTTPIANGDYRSFYITDDPANQRKVRVGEAAEIPRAKITGGEHTVHMYKFGRAIETTYEQMRRQRIDKIAAQIARMAIQAEIDKVAAVIDILVNGDGNSGTAPTTYNLTTLDAAAVAGTLTLKGWLAFKLKFANPYQLQTALVQEAVALQMYLLSTGTANIPLSVLLQGQGIGGFEAINTGLADGTRLGWTSDAPSLKIVGFDSRMAIERIFEINADITETERFITKQTQVLVMTEVEGYGTLDPFSVRILDVNA